MPLRNPSFKHSLLLAKEIRNTIRHGKRKTFARRYPRRGNVYLSSK
jgi:hypothetical protein